LSGQRPLEHLAFEGIGIGLVEVVVSLVVVLTSNSLVMVAELFSGSFEFVSVVFIFLAARALARDNRGLFNYGIGKAENVGSLFVGIFMVVGILLLIPETVMRILHPAKVTGITIWVAAGLAALFICANLRALSVSRRHLRDNPTPIAVAYRRIYVVKAIMDGMIFATLLLTLSLHSTWVEYLDAVVAAIIVGIMVYSAWELIRHAIRDLLDQSVAEPLQLLITRALVRHFDDYASLDEVRSRSAGREVFIDIFLGFEPTKTIGEIQPILDQLRGTLQAEIPHSTVTVNARASAPAR